jgi:hypothetical protein
MEEQTVMNLPIIISLLTALALVSVLAFLLRKVASGNNGLPLTSEWIDDLSLDRYRPMMQMLDGRDIEFLCSQPGYTPDIAKKLRSQRTRIFRSYLSSLEADFGRVCSAIKVVMLQSDCDRPELAEGLLRQQVTFAFAMLSVRAHLFLYSMGLSGVKVSNLVKIFDSMRVELLTMVPATRQMAA